MAANNTSVGRIRRLEDDMSAAWKFLAGSHRLQFRLDARTERIDANIADLKRDMQAIQAQLETLHRLIVDNGTR